MGLFNWFGEQEHRVFHYTPRYYDEDEERRRQMFGKVDGTADKKAEEDEKKNGTYVPGSYLQGAFRGGNYARRRGGNKAQNIIGLIGLILVIGVLFYIAKFFTIL